MGSMPFEPSATTGTPSSSTSSPSAGEEKKQIGAIVWVFLAVGAILLGLVVVLVLWKRAKGGDPLALVNATEVVKMVVGVVGTAANKVEAS